MPPSARPRPRSARLPLGPVLRIFLLGAAGVAACVWALIRHYTHPMAPMLVPLAPSAQVDAGEVEVPVELLEE